MNYTKKDIERLYQTRFERFLDIHGEEETRYALKIELEILHTYSEILQFFREKPLEDMMEQYMPLLKRITKGIRDAEDEKVAP